MDACIMCREPTVDGERIVYEVPGVFRECICKKCAKKDYDQAAGSMTVIPLHPAGG